MQAVFNFITPIFTKDFSYQISDQLVLRFQRRRLKCEKLTDAKGWQKLTLHWQGERIKKIMNTVHRKVPPSPHRKHVISSSDTVIPKVRRDSGKSCLGSIK
jgi:hypothetical protein